MNSKLTDRLKAPIEAYLQQERNLNELTVQQLTTLERKYELDLQRIREKRLILLDAENALLKKAAEELKVKK